jgi:glycosyltransferase involved in cell wall biosynthesis
MRSILFLDTNTEIGGVVTVLTSLLKKMDRGLFKISVACQRGGRTERAMEGIPEQTIVRCSFGTKPSEVRPPLKSRVYDFFAIPITIASIFKLTAYVLKNKVDVLHTSDKIRSVFVTYCVSVFTGRPLVYHIHCGCVPNALNKRALDRAVAIVANSHAMKADYIRTLGSAMERIQVVHSATDTTTEVDGPNLRSELDIPDDAIVVGIASRLAPVKGHHEFLRAAVRVIEQAPDTWFVIAGDDSIEDGNRGYRDRLKALSVSLGIAHRVRFLGFCEEMNPVYRTMDIVVDAAWEEAFGMVVIEPMVFGRPVVATNAGGIPEIIENGVNGILVPPKNHDALADAVLTLVLDESLRNRLGHNAQRIVSERFDVAQLAEKVSAVLQVAGA